MLTPSIPSALSVSLISCAVCRHLVSTATERTSSRPVSLLTASAMAFRISAAALGTNELRPPAATIVGYGHLRVARQLLEYAVGILCNLPGTPVSQATLKSRYTLSFEQTGKLVPVADGLVG